jgi:integrase
MNSTLAIEVSASMPCDQALTVWFEQHKAYIRGGTPRTYLQYIKTLSSFFQSRPLVEISIAEVRAYQNWRRQTCCATRVNAELSNLQMTMKEADLWDERIARLYRPLPVPKTKVRQNMSEEEERRFLAIATVNPRRRLAGHCLIVMANTSMGFGELRHLRRQDVFLSDDPPFVEVNGGTKNDYRIRSIPLNALALRSMRWIVKRWEDLGGSDDEQYILPHRAKRTKEQRASRGHQAQPPMFDVPMGHIYRAARGILKDAGLGHLDPYDMRSHAITKLLSNPNVSDQMYTEIVGHVGDAMKRRYSKQRMENKRVALDAMCAEHIAPEARLIAFPGGKQPERFVLGSRKRRSQPMNHMSPSRAQAVSEPRYVAQEGEALVRPQAPAVEASPQSRIASSPSLGLASGFYVTSWTW